MSIEPKTVDPALPDNQKKKAESNRMVGNGPETGHRGGKKTLERGRERGKRKKETKSAKG